MRKSLLFIILIYSAITCFSQNEKIESEKKFKHYLGITGGTLNGLGFSYKYLPDRIGLQFTVLPPVGEDYHSSYSITTHYRFHSSKKVNLFVNAGFNQNTYMFNRDSRTIGVGFGPEFNNKDIVLSVALNYQVYDIDKESVPMLGIDVGLFYRF